MVTSCWYNLERRRTERERERKHLEHVLIVSCNCGLLIELPPLFAVLFQLLLLTIFMMFLGLRSSNLQEPATSGSCRDIWISAYRFYCIIGKTVPVRQSAATTAVVF